MQVLLCQQRHQGCAQPYPGDPSDVPWRCRGLRSPFSQHVSSYPHFRPLFSPWAMLTTHAGTLFDDNGPARRGPLLVAVVVEVLRLSRQIAARVYPEGHFDGWDLPRGGGDVDYLELAEQLIVAGDV
eukprot:9475318-Pyramimonas_sp.AAC.1